MGNNMTLPKGKLIYLSSAMNRQFPSCWSLFSTTLEMMDLRLGHKLGKGEERRKGIIHGLFLVIFIGSTSRQLLQSEPSAEVQSLRSKPDPF